MNRVVPETKAHAYIVRFNDSLATIARKETGSADYAAIYEQNKDQIGANPNDISVGMVLTIPGSAGFSDEEW